ncbi:MAG: hypothetical protein Q9223_006953 [Gallowayella weberi]
MSAIEEAPAVMPEIEKSINPTSPPTSPPPQPTSSNPIILQVGEQRFHVDRKTLHRSDYLESITSGRWDHNKQPDGSFFIDADPEVFKHILRFLRHGVYPLCYDKSKGHDFAMYAAIQRLADYLLILDLQAWLREAKYLKSVTIETTAEVVEDTAALPGQLDRRLKSDTTVQYHPTWRIVKKYLCPRGIFVHHGNPGRCGRDCRKVQGDAEDHYEDAAILSTLAVTEKTVFNLELCVDEQ